MDTVVIAIGAVSLIIFLSILALKGESTGLPLPPGPRRLPFLGNALDIGITDPHVIYTQWKHQYGDIVYSRLLGQEYIIVNSEKVAKALSDAQRSVIYADRPKLSIYRLLGIETSSGVMAYGDTLRMHRKLFHQTLRSEVIVKYRSFYINKATSLVQDILQDGAASHLDTILKSFATKIVLSLTYGYEISSMDHPVVKLVDGLIDIVTKEGTAEKAALLQTFPFVEYLPSWLPGLGFIERAATSRRLAKEVWDKPFEYTKNEVAVGNAPQSMVADLLISYQEEKGSELPPELEASMKAAAATMYLAGTDTFSSTLLTVILAMILFPEVQEKAQAEIDSVVGKDRLPNFDDREALPYIEAIICEALRWHPPTVLGFPHATTADDVYEGFHIPKGVIVIFNIWAMSRDCANPDKFDPGRHLLPTGRLSPSGRTTGSLSFGFGRRICPGRFFTDSALWAAVVQILATLHFSKATDANGLPVEVNPVFTNGITSHLEPFPLSITGRERTKLINKHGSDHEL